MIAAGFRSTVALFLARPLISGLSTSLIGQVGPCCIEIHGPGKRIRRQKLETYAHSLRHARLKTVVPKRARCLFKVNAGGRETQKRNSLPDVRHCVCGDPPDGIGRACNISLVGCAASLQVCSSTADITYFNQKIVRYFGLYIQRVLLGYRRPIIHRHTCFTIERRRSNECFGPDLIVHISCELRRKSNKRVLECEIRSVASATRRTPAVSKHSAHRERPSIAADVTVINAIPAAEQEST